MCKRCWDEAGRASSLMGSFWRVFQVFDSVFPRIKDVLTHAEYDKDRWKNDPYV